MVETQPFPRKPTCLVFLSLEPLFLSLTKFNSIFFSTLLRVPSLSFNPLLSFRPPCPPIIPSSYTRPPRLAGHLSWLSSVPNPKVHVHSEPQYVILLGNKVSADVIKLWHGHIGFEWPLNPVAVVLIRWKEAVWWWRKRLERCSYKLRKTKSFWEPPQAG